MTIQAVPVARHIPKAIDFNLLHLRRDLAALDGFNAKVALLLTRAVGTMWCFWLFNGIALTSLPSAISQGSPTVMVNWVSSNWIQLVLLPALMVGQRLMQVQSDHMMALMSDHMDLVVDRLDTQTAGGLAEVLAAVREVRDIVAAAPAQPAKTRK